MLNTFNINYLKSPIQRSSISNLIIAKTAFVILQLKDQIPILYPSFFLFYQYGYVLQFLIFVLLCVLFFLNFCCSFGTLLPIYKTHFGLVQFLHPGILFLFVLIFLHSVILNSWYSVVIFQFFTLTVGILFLLWV
jgi:hypothetical protein